MGWWTFGEVWGGSEDPRRGPERVGGPSVGPARVGGHSGRFGTGRGTIGEVRDGSGDAQGVLGRVGGHSGRFVTSRGTFG